MEQMLGIRDYVVPLVRHGAEVTAGIDESVWRGWLARTWSSEWRDAAATDFGATACSRMTPDEQSTDDAAAAAATADAAAGRRAADVRRVRATRDCSWLRAKQTCADE